MCVLECGLELEAPSLGKRRSTKVHWDPKFTLRRYLDLLETLRKVVGFRVNLDPPM